MPPALSHPQLQATLGAKNACAFDLTAACSGFVLGIITAGQFIRAGTSKRVLVVGGDALSRFVDWRDRGQWQSFWQGGRCCARVPEVQGGQVLCSTG